MKSKTKFVEKLNLSALVTWEKMLAVGATLLSTTL